jgi:hypothetical protein
MAGVWFLTLALGQTLTLQDGVTAQLAFQRGLNARQDGRAADAVAAFRLAAEHLEAESLPPSPALSFKAGNAWSLAGDLPRAIAAYRRGLALDPADARLQTALDYARSQVPYPPATEVARLLRPERDWWPPSLTLQHFGGYAFGLYCLACLAVMRWRMTRGRQWLVVSLFAFYVVVIPVAGSGVEQLRARNDKKEPIVVTARDVPLRLGNGTDYPTKLDLPRGCEVRQVFERSGWLQVRTGGGEIGWVPASATVGGKK